MKAMALRAKVARDGRLCLPRLSLRSGAEVDVIILERDATDGELLRAAESSLDFWDNSRDDEVWNNA